jgi:N4-(beta-N-acetylglucosaminyl)-L-asparaginase
MRQGRSPLDACREAIARVVRKRPASSKGWQVAFLAMNKDGEAAGFGLYKGFVYAVCDAARQDALLPAGSVYATGGE